MTARRSTLLGCCALLASVACAPERGEADASELAEQAGDETSVRSGSDAGGTWAPLEGGLVAPRDVDATAPPFDAPVDRDPGQPGDAGCEPAAFVTDVIEHAFGTGQDVGQERFPEAILGPPRGGGCCNGSLDTVSLGNGGSVVVAFARTTIVDGPGPDFVVFENAFNASGDQSAPFAELATVSVSEDGDRWYTFECTATQYPYAACAGWHAVYANADENDLDPLDPELSGGDLFDLADIGVSEARFVRIVDRADLDGFDGVFDLDAVGIIHAACR